MPEYTALMSCASEITCGPDLVQSDRFQRIIDVARAYASVRRYGLDFTIMRRHHHDEPWREVSTGLTAIEVIRRRWGPQ